MINYQFQLPTKPRKNLLVAILLTFFFGPLGLFYVSVFAGIVMTFAIPLILTICGMIIYKSYIINALDTQMPLLMFVVIVIGIYIPICIIWAVVEVEKYNKKLYKEEVNQMLKIQNQIKVSNSETSSNNSDFKQWLKENPGRSINDLYKRLK